MSYFYTNDPIPEGYVLITGKMISTAARRAKIPFRLAYRKPGPGEGHRTIPAGVLIREEDKPAMDTALAYREARKEREKKFCDPTKR